MMLRFLIPALLIFLTPLETEPQGLGGAPRPPTSGQGWVETTTAGAPAGQFWVKMYFRAATSGPPAQTIRTRLTQGAGTTIAGPHDLPATATRDSFALVRPSPGGNSTGNACLEALRGTLSSGPLCGTYSYTEPLGAPLPPVIDSVKTDTLVVGLTIYPRSTSIPVTPLGGPTSRQQFCPVVTFGDGKKTMPQEYLVIPYCQGQYDAHVPLLERAIGYRTRMRLLRQLEVKIAE